MMDWLSKLFGGSTSSAVAKDRLRLVLLSDHIALSPDIVEELRRDLLAVISRYVEVDERNSDVSFEHKEAGIAMLANIPIVSHKSRPDPPRPPRPPAPPVDSQEGEVVAAGPIANGHAPGLATAQALSEPELEPAVIASVAESVASAEPPAAEETTLAAASSAETVQATPARKRRRRRKPSTGGGLPNPAPAQ